MLREQIVYTNVKIPIKFLNQWICSPKCRFLYEDWKYYLNPRCILFDKNININSWTKEKFSSPLFNRCKKCINKTKKE